MKTVRAQCPDLTSEDQDTLGFRRYQNPTGRQLLPLEEEARTDGGSAAGPHWIERIPNQKITGRETTMKSKDMTTIVSLVLVAGFVALTFSLSTGAASVSASSARNGRLHVTKECSAYTGLAGDFCTITSSNIEQIKVGSQVFYDQAAGIPAGLLDSNVVLDAGAGNRAVGRCTLDLVTNLGLCTFSDGTGHLAGFEARVKVDCTSGSAAGTGRTASIGIDREQPTLSQNLTGGSRRCPLQARSNAHQGPGIYLPGPWCLASRRRASRQHGAAPRASLGVRGGHPQVVSPAGVRP